MGITETQTTPSDTSQQVLRDVLALFLVDSGVNHSDFWIQIKANDLLTVVGILRDHQSFQFNHFVDLCGVDYLGKTPRLESVVHLYSFSKGHRIRVRCQVPDENLTVPSLTGFWEAANWQERESYDMYGIVYEGHPNLDRILSPPDTNVFPQRKDYALKGDREIVDDEDYL